MQRFLLIKPWGFGFWSDMEDVQSKLLLAEITNRQPIVFWGEDSLFSVGKNCNSFNQYYMPVSPYSITDVIHDQYTYYPPFWNSSNILEVDSNKFSWAYGDVPSLVNCDADVLVSGVHHFMHEIVPWLKADHPAYGPTDNIDEFYHTRLETGTVLNAHRYIINKYLKLQPDIASEIDEFYQAHMRHKPILAVHIRAGIKISEDPYWRSKNAQYPAEIARYLQANPDARIFLLTDDQMVLDQYKQMYGDILIYTDCTRKTPNDLELCLKDFPDKRRKGIEIIKDTYLASRCDAYIGYWGSNVSRAVRRLKVWDDTQVKIFP